MMWRTRISGVGGAVDGGGSVPESKVGVGTYSSPMLSRGREGGGCHQG